MARITTNTTGTQPVLKIDIVSPVADLTAITVPFLQDITVSNSTGIYSYTTFSDTDTRKLSLQADNELSTNIVLDDAAYFGDGSGTNAADIGLQKISSDKTLVYFKVYFSGTGTGKRFRSGQGYITGLAPTVSPDAPVWVSPLTIAVDGSFTDGVDS